MKTTAKILLIGLLTCLSLSCKKYLDLKPDKTQVIPKSLEDCQALLNNAGILSDNFPYAAQVASDDYYLLLGDWKAMSAFERETYVWQTDARVSFGDWSGAYNRVLVANQILEVLNTIKPGASQQDEWNRIKGTALLLRSMSFYGLSQVFTQPYDVSTATHDLGIPIRLTSSISEKTVRGTVEDVYHRLLQDLQEASKLLPAVEPIKPAQRTVPMPVKAAAFAALARVYLVMGNFEEAFNSADACLKLYGKLIDYKTLNSSETFPIPRYNDEVLYDIGGSQTAPVNRGFVNPELLDSYENGDLRLKMFFRDTGGGKFKFKGTYSQRYTLFAGLAVDEVLLIRAECFARKGNPDAAMLDLNTLRGNRFVEKTAPKTGLNAQEALKQVLVERRRELCFRGLRWSDLRRLNKDPRFAVTISRNLDDQIFVLPPNDLRYTLLIPKEVLDRINLEQNPR